MSARKWMDITVTIRSGMVHWPSDPPVEISRVKDMAKGDGNNVSLLSLGAHSGTHIDAPLHFLSRGRGLDKMPFSATVGRARVIGIKNREVVTVGELRSRRIKPGERIIFKTLNSRYWTDAEFRKDFVHLNAEAAEFLAAKKVRCVGIDYLSVGGYHQDGSQVHKELLQAGIWIIEGLDLSKVRPGNYELICLPLKILNSEAAPARAIVSPI